MPEHDEHDDLAALDFSSPQSESDDDGNGESDALDFSAAADDTDEESDVEALSGFAPTAEPEEAANELDAIAAATEASDASEEEEEEVAQEFTVTNPAGTVSVSALMDGRIQRVKLSPTVTRMTESELAEEITVLAGLARKQGLAGTHTYLFENESQVEGLQDLAELGIDGSQVFRDFVEVGMRLPTPEQADAEQAEVFAARYTDDK
ncbi:hypothetical protein [Mycobacterium sp.]|uniref:hypothetical protein n=1 Tax=Mycobacterium sp. TaxID=1785 RepID=UPI0025EAEDB1|nr:hypothetical protein [Mycobacterium sp.]MBW0014182.1 hypothetical protein [Mycobacterium sp.]